MKHKIYQIYYNKKSHSLIDSNFQPLNNENGPKDWFEFYPMFQTLKFMNLEEDTWYGFLSPKVFEKIDISADSILNTLQKHNDCNVVLFSSSWAFLAMFNNVWDQGEIMHPGLFDEFNNFLKHSNRKRVKRSTLNDFSNSVFSNYVVAKKEFWQEWLILAEDYLGYLESSNSHKETFYRDKQLPLKIFIQERFPSYILNQKPFQVIHANYDQWDHQLSLTIGYPVSNKIFQWLKTSLLSCNEQKKNFKKTKNNYHLLKYFLEKNKVRLIWKLASATKKFNEFIKRFVVS
jgi:hypothetical protein